MTDGDRILWIGDIQDAQSSLVVGLVHQIAMDIQVVITGAVVVVEFIDQDWLIEITHVPDQCPRGWNDLVHFVQLVIHIKVVVILTQPALMGVGCVWILGNGHSLWIRFVGHIRDDERTPI